VTLLFVVRARLHNQEQHGAIHSWQPFKGHRDTWAFCCHGFEGLANHPDIGKRLEASPEANAETELPAELGGALAGYGPDMDAGTRCSGLLHPFFADIAKAISVEARKQGYSLLISSSERILFEIQKSGSCWLGEWMSSWWPPRNPPWRAFA